MSIYSMYILKYVLVNYTAKLEKVKKIDYILVYYLFTYIYSRSTLIYISNVLYM